MNIQVKTDRISNHVMMTALGIQMTMRVMYGSLHAGDLASKHIQLSFGRFAAMD